MFQDPKHLSRFQLIDEGERLQEVTRLPFMEGRDVFVDLTLHFLCVSFVLCAACTVLKFQSLSVSRTRFNP